MRKKTEIRRKAILRVASEVFREKGYQNASMNEIVARLGGSKATLYSYFPSKKLLFQEVMSIAANEKKDEMLSYLDQRDLVIPQDHRNRIEEVFLEMENSHMNIAAILKNFGEKFMQMICLPEFLELYRLAVEGSGRTNIGNQFYQNGPLAGMKRIAGFLEEAMERGQLRKADSWQAASHLCALLHAELFEPHLFRYGDPLSPDVFHEKIASSVDAFMMIYGEKK